nr:hypothetical protein [uncultured Actinotalea sp.]
MHPSLDHELAAREQQRRLAQELHRHELALRARDRATRPTTRRAAPRRASAVRSALGRTVRATRRPSAPAGAPAQRPAAIARPAADGHALAA